VYIGAHERRGGPSGMSYPDYLDIRAQARSLEEMGAALGAPCALSEPGNLPQHYQCSMMTGNSFTLTGLKPAVGRSFLPEDERPGAPPVMLLAHSVWESRYGKDPAVVGKSVRLDSVPTTIIGVMPRGIRFPTETDVWQPLVPGRDTENRGNRNLIVFGRLASGASIATVQAEISTVAQQLASEYPKTNNEIGFRAQTYNQMAVPRKIVPAFYVLLGAVAFVLLIACANVANLMLGRAVTRAREISIRSALGASRWRIIRQLLIESLTLAFAGGAIGWWLAAWGSRAFDAAVIPTGKPSWIDFAPDFHVLLYLSVLSGGAGILFGLAPALRLSRLDVISVLKEGGRGLGAGIRSRSLSGMLVVAEVTLAVILLTGAGLMIRSFLKIYASPTGVDAASLLTMRIGLPPHHYKQPQDQSAFYEHLQSKLESLPGVERASLVTGTPGRGGFTARYELEGSGSGADGNRPFTYDTAVSAGYFRTLRAAMREGREFTPRDGVNGSPVAVVNEAFAARAWPGESALGKRLRIFRAAAPQPWMTVVGVAPDILQDSSDIADHDRILYQPFGQSPRSDFYIVARTHVPPATLAEAFRRAVQSVDEDLPVRDLMTLEAHIDLSRWATRVFGTMFAIFACIAFALASLGLYAVIAHAVSQRTHEIGVRLAMGASPVSVMRLVFAQGMRQLGTGLVFGIAASLFVTNLLGKLLVGVSPHDPLTFVAVAVVLVLAGIAGCAIPARRAVRVDPVVTLRCD
jgi:predicted permease